MAGTAPERISLKERLKTIADEANAEQRAVVEAYVAENLTRLRSILEHAAKTQQRVVTFKVTFEGQDGPNGYLTTRVVEQLAMFLRGEGLTVQTVENKRTLEISGWIPEPKVTYRR